MEWVILLSREVVKTMDSNDEIKDGVKLERTGHE
jgi:hypothetical protein